MRRGLFIFLIAVVLFPVVAVTALNTFVGSWIMGHREETRQFQETLFLVSKHFVDTAKVDTKELTGGAIDHVLRSLDENSEYLPRREAEEFEIETEQRYGGIGVEVQEMDGRVTIVSPFEGSPGELAGLLPGDQIISVDGKAVDGMPYREVVQMLRGPAGSRVAFSVYRPSTSAKIAMEVIRRVIKLDSIREVEMLEPGVGYLRISQFGTQTHQEFRDALEKLERQDMDGLIIDLRNNPGGVLTAAVEVAGEFFERGETVVYTRGRENTHEKVYKTKTRRRDVAYPIVVLVNGGSASASEIVAGALQDIGRATLVGTQTFGKGSVQTIFQYRNGDAMRLTTAMFFTPGGQIIHKQGISPDVVVDIPSEDWNKLMVQRRYLQVLGEPAFKEKHGFEPINDQQLEVALEVVRQRMML